MNKLIKEYIPQVILVVLSVVLGLYLNEWRTERSERKKAEHIVTQIKQEIKENKIILEQVIPYHDSVKNNVALLKDDPQFIKSIVKNYWNLAKIAPNGILQKSTSSTAWETAKLNSAITKIEYDDLRLLSATYNQQSATFAPIKDLMDLINNVDFNHKDKISGNLEVAYRHMREMCGREINLMTYYDRVLKEIN